MLQYERNIFSFAMVSLPHTREQFLDRPKDATAELEQMLGASMTTAYEAKKQALIGAAEELPLPESLRELEEREDIGELRTTLEETPTTVLCALFEDASVRGLLLVLATLELRHRLQEGTLSESDMLLFSMSWLHMSSAGMQERYPDTFRTLPDGLEHFLQMHHRFLAALDALKHHGRPTVIGEAMEHLDRMLQEAETDEGVQALVRTHVEALSVYFDTFFGDLTDKSSIARANHILWALRSVQEEKTLAFMERIAQAHRTPEIRFTAISVLLSHRDMGHFGTVERIVKEEGASYLGRQIRQALADWAEGDHLSQSERDRVCQLLEDVRSGT